MAYRVVLSTINDRHRAEEIAHTLLQAQMVACVNIIGPLVSLYRWQGHNERAEEYLLLMKTTAGVEPALIARLQELHPYEVPEIIVLPIETGAAAYLTWIAQSVLQES